MHFHKSQKMTNKELLECKFNENIIKVKIIK